MKKARKSLARKRGAEIKRLLETVSRQETFNQMAASMKELFFTPLFFQVLLDAKGAVDAVWRINAMWEQLFIQRLKIAAKRERAKGVT